MFHSQSENKKKRRSLLLGVLIVMLLIGMTVGGVSAYLSMSASEKSSFTNAEYPIPPAVLVDGTSVTVTPNGYAVYLRVAVDANWMSGKDIVPGEPSITFTLGTDWMSDGSFYYYVHPITETTDPPLTIPVTAATHDTYSTEINVAAQLIQAVGKTDDRNVDAVQDAWKVTF